MTQMYQHILAALDLSEHSKIVVRKAKQFVELTQAKLTFLHVIEPSLEAEHIYVDMDEYKKIMMHESKQKYNKLITAENISKSELILELGNSKSLIVETANKLGCDLILVGSHGRHGLQLLLGSTSSAVLHKANCDVFVVRYTK